MIMLERDILYDHVRPYNAGNLFSIQITLYLSKWSVFFNTDHFDKGPKRDIQASMKI